MGTGLGRPWPSSPLLGSRTARVYSNPALEVARPQKRRFVLKSFGSPPQGAALASLAVGQGRTLGGVPKETPGQCDGVCTRVPRSSWGTSRGTRAMASSGGHQVAI